MASIVQDILSLPVADVRQWGYWIVFSASLFETVPLAGSFVPGHTVVIVGGLFAKMGVLDFWRTCAISAFGAFLGDFVGYGL